MMPKLQISAFHYQLSHLSRRFISTLHSTESVSILHHKFNHFLSIGNLSRALSLYRYHLHPNAFILPSLVKASSSLRSRLLGLQLHCIAIKSGLDYDSVVSNSFISLYAKFSDYENALKVFDGMPLRDAISWNAVVNCSIQNGYFSKAFEFLKEMYTCGFVPKAELIASAISVIERVGSMNRGLGRAIHGLVIVDERIEDEVFVKTSLVDWYFKSGDSSMALRVFHQMEVKNEVSWTAVVAGCSTNLEFEKALDCFRAMQINGVRPNRVTLITVLPAIAELGGFKHGKEIHGFAFRHGFDSDHHFSSSLIHFYSNRKEGLKPARLIFLKSEVKDCVMYGSIIRICSRYGESNEALKLFNQMRGKGIRPNSFTLLAAINACTNLASLKHGTGTHGYIVKSDINSDISVGNALINMYSKCGSLIDSHRIFEEMQATDSVSWSTLIAGYGLHGYGEKALCLFREMQVKGVEADEITVLSVLSACNHSGLVQEGQEIFDEIKKEGKVQLSVEHYACLIDLLGKSGEIVGAFGILQTMPMKPSAKIWSSLVSACKTHGYLELAEMTVQNVIESNPGNAGNHTLLSMIYAESGKWCGVEEARRVMRAQGLNKSYGFSRISAGY